MCSASPGLRIPSFIESSFCTKLEYETWLRTEGCEAAIRDGGKEAQWKEHKGSGLDMKLLRRRDIPILHFVDIPLYEDDLGDNGESMLRLRLRVMPSCFFILLRHALRIDGLLIRQHETRIFHKFGTPQLLRARRLAEAPLEPLRKVEPLPDKPGGAAAPATVAPCGPWTATMPPLSSVSHPNEHQAAERLAMLPPKSDIIEELLLV